MREKTLIVIKPGAVKRRQAGEIISALEHAMGLQITEVRSLTMTVPQAEAFYAEHRGREHFARTVEHAASGLSIAVLVEGDGVVARVRTLLGNADPQLCDGRQHLRGRFGWQMPDNGLHASDSCEAYERELDVITPKPAVDGTALFAAAAAAQVAGLAAEPMQPSDPAKEQLPPGGQFPDAAK